MGELPCSWRLPAIPQCGKISAPHPSTTGIYTFLGMGKIAGSICSGGIARMKTTACSLLAAVLACLSASAQESAETTDTRIVGMQQQIFRDIGPRRSVL